MPSDAGPPAAGPLAGVRVVELASLAPAPFGCMVLADLGADVVRVDRPARPRPGRLGRPDDRSAAPRPPGHRARPQVTRRGGRPAAPGRARRRAGRGRTGRAWPSGSASARTPATTRNPRLVYARMTGWGQDGPLAARAGHDIDYIAVAGGAGAARAAPASARTPPLNLLGDFGGGGMLLAVGVLAALLERERSGLGQVVDAAMVDGVGAAHRVPARAASPPARGRAGAARNLLDGGAPFYDTYAHRRRPVRRGRRARAGSSTPSCWPGWASPTTGPARPVRPGRLAGAARAGSPRGFAGRTRDEWAALFAGLDACVAPVLAPAEARRHPHNAARGTFVRVGGETQPAPAPRFARTPTPPPRPAPDPAHPLDVTTVLDGWPDRR